MPSLGIFLKQVMGLSQRASGSVFPASSSCKFRSQFFPDLFSLFSGEEFPDFSALQHLGTTVKSWQDYYFFLFSVQIFHDYSSVRRMSHVAKPKIKNKKWTRVKLHHFLVSI